MALSQGRLGPLPARRLHALRPTVRSTSGSGSLRAPAYSASPGGVTDGDRVRSSAILPVLP
eukprot:8534995-Pyramimonas_sp.AAC.1